MAEDFTMSPPESLFIHITSFEPQIIVSQEDNLTAVCLCFLFNNFKFGSHRIALSSNWCMLACSMPSVSLFLFVFETGSCQEGRL